MSSRGFCKGCGDRFQRKRNPKQSYCSKLLCQTRRKQSWRKTKMTKDHDYRSNQRASNKRWQLKNPGYWKQYREKKPSYVKANRAAQKARDKKKQQDSPSLAKSDAFISAPLILPGLYRLMPVVETTLAKSDALSVKILIEPEQTCNNQSSCKETTL